MPKFMAESSDSDFMDDEKGQDEAFYSDSDEEQQAKTAKPGTVRNASMTSSKTPMATSTI